MWFTHSISSIFFFFDLDMYKKNAIGKVLNVELIYLTQEGWKFKSRLSDIKRRVNIAGIDKFRMK